MSSPLIPDLPDFLIRKAKSVSGKVRYFRRTQKDYSWEEFGPVPVRRFVHTDPSGFPNDTVYVEWDGNGCFSVTRSGRAIFAGDAWQDINVIEGFVKAGRWKEIPVK